MALLEKQLFVKTSTLPNAGKGLFTKKMIPKGTRVVEYKGRITTWKEVKDSWDNGYIYSVNNNHVIDAKKTLSALARYANDARGIVRIKGVTNNCHYMNDGVRAYIESIKDIPAGGEIFVSYGNEYWQVQRENIRIDKKKAKEQAKTPGTKAKAAPKKKTATKKKTGKKAL